MGRGTQRNRGNTQMARDNSKDGYSFFFLIFNFLYDRGQMGTLLGNISTTGFQTQRMEKWVRTKEKATNDSKT